MVASLNRLVKQAAKYQPMLKACECEHISHMKGEDKFSGHNYGHEFDIEEMTMVKTDYGTFTVCVRCASTCLKGWEKK